MRILSTLTAIAFLGGVLATIPITTPASAQDQQAAAQPITGQALRDLVENRTWQWGRYIEHYHPSGLIYGWEGSKSGTADYGGGRTSWSIGDDCVDLFYEPGSNSNGCWEITDLGNGKYRWTRPGDRSNDGVLVE